MQPIISLVKQWYQETTIKFYQDKSVRAFDPKNVKDEIPFYMYFLLPWVIVNEKEIPNVPYE